MKNLPRLVTLTPLSVLLLATAYGADAAGPAPSLTPNCSQMSVGSRRVDGKISTPIMVSCTPETMKNNSQCVALCTENAAWAANPNPKPPTPSFHKQ